MKTPRDVAVKAITDALCMLRAAAMWAAGNPFARDAIKVA